MQMQIFGTKEIQMSWKIGIKLDVKTRVCHCCKG